MHELRTAFLRRASTRPQRTALFMSKLREGMSQVTTHKKSPGITASGTSPAPAPSLFVLLRVLLGGFGCRHRRQRDGFDALEFDPPTRSRRACPSLRHPLSQPQRDVRPFFLIFEGDLSEFEMLEKQLCMHQRLDGGEGSSDGWTDHLLCLFCLSVSLPPTSCSSLFPFLRLSLLPASIISNIFTLSRSSRLRFPPPSLHFASPSPQRPISPSA